MEMCTQDMEWDFLYILQISKRHTFQELATNVDGIDVTVICHDNSFCFSVSKKDKIEFKSILKELNYRGDVISNFDAIRIIESLNKKIKVACLS